MRLTLMLAMLSVVQMAAAVDVWTPSEMKRASGELTPEAEAKGIAGKTLAPAATLWRRAHSGQAELHRTKTDLLVIEDGTATLVSGGTIPDGHSTASGEIRGSRIEGGETRRLAAGDIVRIPAGTPHQFVLAKGESVAYFALKIGR